MTPLIERNTTIPVRKTETFSTAEDGQTAVTVHVLQGERPMAADNVTLGRFNLEGIPPAPRGMPQIDVTFDIDANGILNVSAKDKATGKEQQITITATTNLTESEVEELVKEAKRHESEDRRRKELVEARNTADQLIYQMEKMLRDLGEQVAASDRQRIEQIVEDLKAAKEGDDAARIRSLIEQLQQASQAIGQQIYAQQQAAAGAGPQPGPGAGPQAGPRGEAAPGEGGGEGGDEDVVEGEFREV
jgi:molecular chaperone DnaK